MRLKHFLSAIFAYCAIVPCPGNSGILPENVSENLRALHIRCEKAYMRNDWCAMRPLLDETSRIMDSLVRAGHGMAAISGHYALYCKDEGSCRYCMADLDKGNYAEAERFYMLSLSTYRKYGNDPIKKAALHSELAQLYYKTERYEEAARYLEMNLEIYEKGWEEAARRTLSEIALCKARMGKFQDALDDMEFAMDGNRNTASGMEMIRKKGKILALKAEAEGGDLKEAAGYFKRYFNVQKDSLTDVFLKMTPDERERYWLRMHPFLTDCYRIEDEDAGFLYDVTLFSKSILLQFSMSRNRPVGLTWRDIQDNLREGESAVEFICYQARGCRQLGALVLNKHGRPEFHHICMEKDLLDISLNGDIRVEDALRGRNEDYIDYLYACGKVKETIWNESLMKSLENSRKIYFSPDGMLHLIGIEYMFPETGSPTPSLHRLTGTRELAGRQECRKTGRMLMCGGLDFNSGNTGKNTGYENDMLAYRIMKNLNPHFSYLPGSEREVEAVSSMRNAQEDLMLRASEATEDRCPDLFNRYPVILLSTHGYFSGEIGKRGCEMHPCISDLSLSESVLLLSGAQKNIEDPLFDPACADGILSAREISGLDLENVELFIVSACQSGLGHVTADGVYGIQRGLKNAGVKSMIVSLWNVNDDATRHFMTCLCSEMSKGADIHSAFEHARERMEDVMEYGEWRFNPGKMRGEYVSGQKAVYARPRYRNAFILIDNI